MKLPCVGNLLLMLSDGTWGDWFLYSCKCLKFSIVKKEIKMRERESERERRIKQDPSTGNFFDRKGD